MTLPAIIATCILTTSPWICVQRLPNGYTVGWPGRITQRMVIDKPCVIGRIPKPGQQRKPADEFSAAMKADAWSDIDRESRSKTGESIEARIGRIEL